MDKSPHKRAVSLLVIAITCAFVWYSYAIAHDIFGGSKDLRLLFWSNLAALTILLLYRAFDVWKGS